jgi:uncharacterized protein (TIGR03437 family)
MSSAPRCARGIKSLLVWSCRTRLVLFSLGLCLMVAWGGTRFTSQAQRPVPGITVVSAATFTEGPVAPESIVTVFGADLATSTAQANTLPLSTTLGGTRVTIRDSRGVERAAGLFFVSFTQVNLQLPADLAAGTATIIITNARNEGMGGTLQIAAVAPGLFAANGSGQGAAAGLLLRVPQTGGQSFEPLAEVNAEQNRIVTRPLQLNRVNVQAERLFLVLFGTGWRQRANLDDVRAYIGGVETMVTFAGAQPGAVGLDQVNIPLDAALIAKLTGRGRVAMAISVAGFGSSNVVEIEVASGPGTPVPQIMGFEFEGGRSAALVGETVKIKGSNFSIISGQNRVRIGGREALVIGAFDNEIIIRVPFGVETAPVIVTTPRGEGTSRTSLPIRTSVSGVVENTQRQPLPGVLVQSRLLPGLIGQPTTVTARTNADGVFVLPDVLAGQLASSALLLTIDGTTLNVTPDFPQLTLGVLVQAGRDHALSHPIWLQQPHGAGIKVEPLIPPAARALSVPAAPASFADDWLPALPASNPASAQADPAQSCGVTGAINLALPLNASVFVSCSLTLPVCPYPIDRFYVNGVENSRVPFGLPRGHFSSTIAQIAPFDTRFNTPAALTLPNSYCLPAGATVKLFGTGIASGSISGGLTGDFLGRFDEIGAGQVAPDGRSITAIGGITRGGLYFFTVARPTATLIGRVVEPGPVGFGVMPELVPVVGAQVTARGQTVFTDGNGAFVLPGVPVLGASDRIGLDVTFLRATGRVERALLTEINLSAEQTRSIGDVVLSAPDTNRPPVLIAAPALIAEEGKANDFDFIAAEADAGQTVQVMLSGAPLGALINRGNNLYTLRVTPGLEDAGEYTLTLTATDSLGATTMRRITLTVANSNQAPVALAQTITIDEDTAQNITLTATDADRDALRYFIVVPPQRGQLTGDAPDLRYTPDPNFFGTDGFAFIVNDGLRDSAPVTVKINVRAINDAPELTLPGEQHVAPGQTISFNIAASDVDASDAISFMLVNPPAGATLQPVTGGNHFSAQFTWTPMMAGTYVVTFKATDNGAPALNATASVAITVGAQNQAAWMGTAGPIGGTITALLANDATILAGTRNNGVYRSTDNGVTWQRASQGLPAKLAIIALARFDNALFAGTGLGVYRSTDNGNSWTAANEGLEVDGSFRGAVRTLLARGSLLFAGLSDNVGFSGGGLYLSTNGGQSWQPVAALANVGINALVATETAIFAGSLGSGVYRSTDNGQSWTVVNSGLTSLIYVLAARGTTVFAGGLNGLFRSDDSGQSWVEVSPNTLGVPVLALLINGDNLLIGTSVGIHRLRLSGGAPQFNPTSPVEPINALAANNASVFAGTTSRGVFRASAGGGDWADSNAGLTNVEVSALVALDSSLFAGTDFGVSVTSDRGQTWQLASNGLPVVINSVPGLLERVIALVTDGTNLYAGLEHGGVYRSRDGGRNWEPSNEGLPLSFLQSLGASGTTLLASYGDQLSSAQLFRSTDQGQSWTVVGAGLPSQPVFAYAARGTKLFAAAGSEVYVSTDNGTSWTVTGAGLPTNRGVLSLLASGGRLFVGTAGSGVFVSNDDGESWTAAGGNPPVNGNVIALAASGANVLANVVEVYALPAIPSRFDPRCPNGGVFIDGRCFGTVQPGSRFSGAARTYFGLRSRIFISPDAGQNWAPIMGGLSDVPLTVLQSSGAHVFLGTFGGGVFVRQF